MNKYTLIILSLILLSCSERKITKDTFIEFEKTIADSILITESSPIVNKNTIAIKKQAEDYFGALEADKLKALLQAEIQSLQKDSSYSLPASQMIINQDTTMTLRRCGTYDTADNTVPKGYSNRRMLIPNILDEVNVVPINFYIIDKSNPDWEVQQSDLQTQLNILNEAFAEINLEFILGQVLRYTNDDWHLAFSSNETGDKVFNDYFEDMVTNLPLNGNQMNVIINGCNLLGQAALPYEETLKTKYDHVIINRNSLKGKLAPGSTTSMEGDTLIHEMGHYFGLLHTFHSSTGDYCDLEPFNGCSEGDLVSDTPPQKFCHMHDCNMKDTCTSDTFEDDIKNYMGYNPDNCMSHFTKGQYNRMEHYFYGDRYYLVSSL